MLDAWRNKALRLANLGYFGHMWELYAMWAWIGVFFQASFVLRMDGINAALYAKLSTFAVIAAGAAGCLVGGVIADRLGRTTLTMGAMLLSGTCAAIAGFLFGAAPWLVVTVGVVWGVAIVADSAQFSSSVMELSSPDRVGTMVTIQTSVGFLLTLATIHMVPRMVEAAGWGWAFATLAIGPALGTVAMYRLRRHPDSIKLAGGRR
ncbi:MAG: MFS transporter [Proteobacteria bacterium]|nr:MFS transporter [Pseudomonadota bacterium]